MKVLLSIKPEFAELIFSGTKKYEFRRTIFKDPRITKIVVYASSPVQKVIGEFDIENILNCDLDTLWNKTQRYSGITEDYFMSYFTGKESGFAIKVRNTKLYKTPKCIRKDFNCIPPQSFLYL